MCPILSVTDHAKVGVPRTPPVLLQHEARHPSTALSCLHAARLLHHLRRSRRLRQNHPAPPSRRLTCSPKATRVVTLRNPGVTPLGDRIRAILLDSAPNPPSAPSLPLAEMALMFADRAQSIAEIILPATRRRLHRPLRPLHRLLRGLPGRRPQLGSERILAMHAPSATTSSPTSPSSCSPRSKPRSPAPAAATITMSRQGHRRKPLRARARRLLRAASTPPYQQIAAREPNASYHPRRRFHRRHRTPHPRARSFPHPNDQSPHHDHLAYSRNSTPIRAHVLTFGPGSRPQQSNPATD